MNYQFRKGTLEDKEKLRLLGLNSFGRFRNILTDENWNKLRLYQTAENTYPELLAKSTCFVCEENNEIIGMAYLVPSGNPTDIFQENWCYLRMVGVHTEHGGKGIGKKLTQMCIDFARNTGEKIMALHTSEFMNAARHIYENSGFKQLREIEPRLGKKYWIYTLEL